MAIVNLNCGGGGKYKNVLASLIDRSITEIEIPEGVTKIGSYAFGNCKKLASATIPESVTVIEGYAFHDCSALTEITILDSVTSLGSSCFHGCTGLTKIKLSDNIKTITANTLYQCSNIKELVLPSKLTSIQTNGLACANCEKYDFTRCTVVPTLHNLNGISCSAGDKILVPASLYDQWIVATNWAQYADYIVGVRGENEPSEGLEMILSDDGTYYQVAGMGECTDTDVIIPSEYNGLPVKAFYNGLAHEDFDGVFTDDDIVSITVPDSITDFDVPFAVFFCNSLKMLNLGSGVTINEESIPGHFTIMGNSSLEKITVSENNPYLYTNESGTCLFTGDGALLISLDGTIPDGTVTICDYVFENGAPVTNELKMPPSVAKIDQSLFFAVWDFSNHTFVPSLSKNTGNPKKIIVPAALLYEWKNATNWCEFADVIVAAE